MKQRLFSLYFRILDGRDKQLQSIYHYYPEPGRNYPYDGDLVRTLIDCAARNFTLFGERNDCVEFRRFVASYDRVHLLYSLKPTDVAEAMNFPFIIDGYYHLEPRMFWDMSVADLHAVFGLFLDYRSALPELVEYAASAPFKIRPTSSRVHTGETTNLCALMVAVAYSKCPDAMAAEYTHAKERCDHEGQWPNLFYFARGLLSKA